MAALAWTAVTIAAIVAVAALVLVQRVDPRRGNDWEDPAARKAADNEHRRVVR